MTSTHGCAYELLRTSVSQANHCLARSATLGVTMKWGQLYVLSGSSQGKPRTVAAFVMVVSADTWTDRTLADPAPSHTAHNTRLFVGSESSPHSSTTIPIQGTPDSHAHTSSRAPFPQQQRRSNAHQSHMPSCKFDPPSTVHVTVFEYAPDTTCGKMVLRGVRGFPFPSRNKGNEEDAKPRADTGYAWERAITSHTGTANTDHSSVGSMCCR